MDNPLVDEAMNSLRLLGIPLPASMSSLVELLINEGEDVHSAVPRIVSTIEQLGGSTMSVLDEVANGMAQYGPTGYVQRLLNGYFAPQVQKVQQISHGKGQLTALHRMKLETLKKQLVVLTAGKTTIASGGSATYAGPSADAMMVNVGQVSAHMERLLAAMDQSRQIDADLQSDIERIIEGVAALAIVDLILLAAVFIITFVGTALALAIPAIAFAPETGGITLGLDLGVAGAAGIGTVGATASAILPFEAAALLGALLDAFGRWATRHVMLSISPTVGHATGGALGPLHSQVTINQARSHQNDLPTGGDYPYIPPKQAHEDPSRAWDGAKSGFKDIYGNIWIWDKQKNDHWDVEHKDGSHTNIRPDGKIDHGANNFPNKPGQK
jgi:hypothetical protein